MRKSANRLARRAGGFTLVELLLALTLMSMLLALAYGGLRASTRAADKGQTVLEDSGRIRMAHQFIRKQINQMIPLVFEESEDQQDRSVFQGDRRKIRFVGPMPGYLGFGGPQVQELAIVPGDEGDKLVFSHALLQGFEEQNLYERDPIVLLEHIEGAEFGFLGLDEFGLPECVSLSIEFTEEVYIQWPLLTAAVRIDSEGLSDSNSNILQDKRFRARAYRQPAEPGTRQ